MKIVELKIDDSLMAGIDAVALVESPAIEQDFIAFGKQQFETYNDYPQAAIDAAKQGIKRNEEIGNKCATQVGKVRAQQLANGEAVSIDTIKRMRSFLIRQKDNYELAQSRKDYYACGYISYLLWGGPAALPWAEKKLRQAGIEFKDEVMQFAAEGRDIYLISCSAQKKDYACAACELYDSALFEKSLSFARKQTEDKYIKILSAEYGLVDLDQVIEPYDKTLKDMPAEERMAWAESVYEAILDGFNVDKDRFVFLAGNAYTEYLMPKFTYNKDLLEGMRIGERMEYLDKFCAVTNNAFYAVKHKFDNVEQVIVEELIKQGMAESAMGLSVGDYVSWTYAGRQEGADRGRGQIKSIRTQGKVNIPDSDVTLNASKDRPVALIETRTGQVVGQFVDNLRKIQKPDDFAIDVTSLPDYTAEVTGSLSAEFVADLPEYIQDALVEELSKVGTPFPSFLEEYEPINVDEVMKEAAFAIKASAGKPSEADFANIQVRYRYSGPLDDNTRSFCAKLMSKNLIFRKEDIAALTLSNANKEFGTYDIFKYKGSFNCRHRWEELLFRKKDSSPENRRPIAQSGRIFDATTVNNPVLNTQGKKASFAAQLAEKQMLMGPLMTPNKLIPRINEEGEEYYVYFTEDTVEKLAYKMMEDKLVDSVNIEHDGDQKVNEVYLVETWLVKDVNSDKSRLYGYEPIKGQWFGIYKVKNKSVWDEYVKTGKVKGFSVEGYFAQKILMNKL